MSRWLEHVLGMDNGSSPYYLSLSGWMGLLGFVGIIWSTLRKHNCHVRWCPRIGRFPVEGTVFTVCRRHHPDGHVDHADVLAAHRRALHLRHGGHNEPGPG